MAHPTFTYPKNKPGPASRRKRDRARPIKPAAKHPAGTPAAPHARHQPAGTPIRYPKRRDFVSGPIANVTAAATSAMATMPK